MNTENKTSSPASDAPASVSSTPPKPHNDKAVYDITGEISLEDREALKALQEKMRQEREERAVKIKTGTFSLGQALRLDVMEFPTPITLTVTGDMIVGRADNITNYTPEIDLAPYGAYRLGISRRHAIVRLMPGNTLSVTDLGSRNGTMVNNQKLIANAPFPLKDGDELAIGTLLIRVTFLKK
jgi:hypothetical protein